MDLSEFEPPVRLSMSDEDIQSALGSASANEEGMLAAMAMLEEQALLRDQDNQAIAAWKAKLQADERPEAAVALENFERAKSGLPPLPLVQEAPTVAAPAASVEPALAFEADPFETLLAGVNEEATTAVETVDVEAPLPIDLIESVVTNFETSADEDAFAFEESVQFVEKTKSDKTWLFRLGSGALFGGVVPAAVIAFICGIRGIGFGSALLGYGIGLALSYALSQAGLVSAARAERSFGVLLRATFGVFGASLPGIAIFVSRITLLLFVSTISVTIFTSALPSGPQPATPTLIGVPYGLIIQCSLVLVVGLTVAFASRFLKWKFAVMGAFVTLIAAALAILSAGSINFSSLAFTVDWNAVLVVAVGAFMIHGVAMFTLDSRSLATTAALPNGWLQNLLFPVVQVLIPLAAFGHLAALFASGKITMASIFGASESMVSAFGPWVLLVIGVVLMVGLFDGALEAVGTFGTNARQWWHSLVAIVLAVALLIAVPDYMFTLAAASLGIFAVALGAFAAEALIRRGSYHDASLLRGYGFYKRFNILGLLTFVIGALGILVLERVIDVAQMGFNIDNVIDAVGPFAPLLGFGFTFVLTFATSIPRILEQQAEARDIEERRKSLSSVSFG